MQSPLRRGKILMNRTQKSLRHYTCARLLRPLEENRSDNVLHPSLPLKILMWFASLVEWLLLLVLGIFLLPSVVFGVLLLLLLKATLSYTSLQNLHQWSINWSLNSMSKRDFQQEYLISFMVRVKRVQHWSDLK